MGLSPHQLTPIPYVHKAIRRTLVPRAGDLYVGTRRTYEVGLL
jgi:hypothetical protein